MIQTGLYALFAENMSGVLVYPATLPEGVDLPAMVYRRISGTGEPTFNTAGLQRVRMQFDFFAVTAVAAAAAAAQFRAFFDGFVGRLSDGTYLQDVQYITDSDTYDDAPRQYRCVSDFYLWFTIAA